MSTTSALGSANSAADSSTLSSILSALNSGSQGIDVTDTVNSIIAADEAPMDQWETQQTTLSNETSAIDQLESEASSLSDQLNSLQDPAGVLSNVSATSSNDAVVTASALPGSATGNHTIVVNNLATAGSWYSSDVASSSTALSSGSFEITTGGQTTSIPIGNGVDTLDELAASINSDSLGVSASVVTDTSGARLSLVAQSTGAASDFSVSSASGLSFTHLAAQDASLTVDGVPVSSASNTVSGVVSGLTLNLVGTAPGTPVTVSLAPDTTDIVSTVGNFVSAYNTLINDVNSQFAYNAANQTDGTLSSDSAVRSFQSDLLGSTNFALSSGGTLPTLASIGVSTNQDGTLTLDSATLTSAIQNNFSGVASFFQSSGSTTGFAATLNNTLSNYTDPAQGAFTVDLSSMSSESQDLGNQIDTFEQSMVTEQATLTTEYNNANIALQQLPSQIKQTQILLGEDNSSSNS